MRIGTLIIGMLAQARALQRLVPVRRIQVRLIPARLAPCRLARSFLRNSLCFLTDLVLRWPWSGIHWELPAPEQPRKRSGGRDAMLRLVAIACADSHALAARSPAAAEHSSARLGLHTRAKPVLLQAALAVGLKCALRHGMRSSIC